MRLFDVLVVFFAGCFVVGGIYVLGAGLAAANHGAPIAGALLIIFGFLMPLVVAPRRR